MIKRWLLAALLCCVATACFAQAAMRPDQMTARSWSWLGRNATPTCTLSTTTGAIAVTAAPPCSSDATKGVAWNLVGPLTGNATLGFPTNLVDGASMGFLIAHGSGGSALAFANGYYFPNAAMSGGQPTLTNSANAVDMVVCQAITVSSTLSMWCGSPPLNMTAATNTPIVIGSPNVATGTGTGTTTLSVSVPSVVAGDTILILIGWCGNSGCNGAGAEVVSSATATGGTCAAVAGTNSGSLVNLPANMYRCTGVSAGTASVAVNWSANAFFQKVVALDIRNDNGVEAGANNSGTNASPTVTSGTLSQTNGELVISWAFALNNSNGVGSPFTAVNIGGQVYGYAYTSSCSGCTLTPVFTVGSAGAWSNNIVGILHP